MRGGAAVESLVIWRESVAAGDDVYAPHELLLPAPPGTSVRDVVGQLIAARYLASITGGKATWILDADRPLAVLAQQWSEARFLVDAEVPVWPLVRRHVRPHLNVRYWCQADPGRVFECLLVGQPLPDRYGG